MGQFDVCLIGHKEIRIAFIASSACDTFVTPIIGVVPLAITHANVTCAGDTPYFSLMTRITVTSFSICGNIGL